MTEIITKHDLRTIILKYDDAVAAPEFEQLALKYYTEIHDRTWKLQQRVRTARAEAGNFHLQQEEIEELFLQAKGKLEHLQVMIPDNPERERVSMQLNQLLDALDEAMEDFVPRLTAATVDFYAYDELIFTEDQWAENVAFPQFGQVIENYQQCAVDLVSFDRDLDDFKGAYGFFKRQEGKYYDLMNDLMDSYSELNNSIGNLFGEVEKFNPDLIGR